MAIALNERECFHPVAAFELRLIRDHERMARQTPARVVLLAGRVERAIFNLSEFVLQRDEDCIGLFERRVVAPFIGGFIVNLFVTAFRDVIGNRADS